jgi:hypothetical protein
MNKERIEAMQAVAGGADVRSYLWAKELRAVEKEHPEWIDIVPCRMGPYGVKEKHPYFGAILTNAGTKALREAKKLSV